MICLFISIAKKYISEELTNYKIKYWLLNMYDIKIQFTPDTGTDQFICIENININRSATM